MATFPVIFSNTAPASITITGANTSYTLFKNSLGSFVYILEKIFLSASNVTQINQVMLYSKYDSNGDRRYTNLTPILSPFQQVGAFELETKGDEIVLDGLSRLNFIMEAGVSLTMQLIAKRIAVPDYLNHNTPTNYQQVETAMGLANLFDNYTNSIYDPGTRYTIYK